MNVVGIDVVGVQGCWADSVFGSLRKSGGCGLKELLQSLVRWNWIHSRKKPNASPASTRGSTSRMRR